MRFRQIFQGFDGGMLLIRIKGSVDFKSFFIQCVVTVFLGDFLSDVVNEVCRFIR